MSQINVFLRYPLQHNKHQRIVYSPHRLRYVSCLDNQDNCRIMIPDNFCFKFISGNGRRNTVTHSQNMIQSIERVFRRLRFLP